MPARNHPISMLVEKVYGGPWVWDGRTGECKSEGWSADQHDEAVNRIGELFDLAVDFTDWSRVIIEACACCARSDHEHKGKITDDICAASIAAVLKSTERFGFDGTVEEWGVHA